MEMKLPKSIQSQVSRRLRQLIDLAKFFRAGLYIVRRPAEAARLVRDQKRICGMTAARTFVIALALGFSTNALFKDSLSAVPWPATLKFMSIGDGLRFIEIFNLDPYELNISSGINDGLVPGTSENSKRISSRVGSLEPNEIAAYLSNEDQELAYRFRIVAKTLANEFLFIQWLTRAITPILLLTYGLTYHFIARAPSVEFKLNLDLTKHFIGLYVPIAFILTAADHVFFQPAFKQHHGQWSDGLVLGALCEWLTYLFLWIWFARFLNGVHGLSNMRCAGASLTSALLFGVVMTSFTALVSYGLIAAYPLFKIFTHVPH